MSKKSFEPEDINDLTDIYYNPDRAEDREKYESLVQGMLSEIQENEIKNIFSVFGDCQKVPTRKNKKTVDFKIDEAKLLIEGHSYNPNYFIVKTLSYPTHTFNVINTAIKHAEEKDYSEFPGYFKGEVIHWSSKFLEHADPWSLKQDKNFLEIIQKSQLDYLIILPQEASISGHDSREVYPPLVFVKVSLRELFKQKLPKNYEIYEI